MRVTYAVGLTVALAALALVAAPAQAQDAPEDDGDASSSCTLPLPSPVGPVDELDDAAFRTADGCFRAATGYPLPARADADAACDDRRRLIPGCAADALIHCTNIDIDDPPPCAPAAGTTVWFNASAFRGYCLDCAPDLDLRYRHEDLETQSLSWRLTLGLYICQGEVGSTPDGTGPAPGIEADGSCPPFPVP